MTINVDEVFFPVEAERTEEKVRLLEEIIEFLHRVAHTFVRKLGVRHRGRLS